jgi:hypothetical protein
MSSKQWTGGGWDTDPPWALPIAFQTARYATVATDSATELTTVEVVSITRLASDKAPYTEYSILRTNLKTLQPRQTSVWCIHLGQ